MTTPNSPSRQGRSTMGESAQTWFRYTAACPVGFMAPNAPYGSSMSRAAEAWAWVAGPATQNRAIEIKAIAILKIARLGRLAVGARSLMHNWMQIGADRRFLWASPMEMK